ncbi:unnamed protein product [Symbiodinium sp. KB8]|nr:unnamed protein product [Symbiodinium sp. KB8]
MPPCLYKDPAAVDRSIYRTAGKWTYWDLLPDDIRKPPPQFCNEIEDSEPLPKPMPTKPAQATQPPQEQPLPADRPGSSKDDPQDLSSADPASVYKPLSGQDLHIDAFRNLDPSNWVYKAHGKVLCKRFQRNLCTDIASEDPQPTPAPGPPLVAGQEEEVSPGRANNVDADTATQHIADQCPPPKTTSFRRSFANRVWTSPSYHCFPASWIIAFYDALNWQLAYTTRPSIYSELLALEALGRISQLPLRLGHITEVSHASLLKTSGPFIAHRPPICDGAGAPSSADHSLPHASGISKASKAWMQWAQKSDLSNRVFAHISQSRPEHLLSQEEQSEALAILCSALNLDQASMATVSPGQPFRLQLMQALAELTDDPDQDLPSILAEGVHTGVFSEIKPSGLWPPAKLQPLSQSGLEVCQGNWRPAEEDPDTVAALLAEEEAAGWIQQVPGGLTAAKKRWPQGIAVGKLSLVKAEGRDPRLVLDSTICQVNPLCRIPEAVTMSSYQLEEGHTWIRISDPSCPVIKMTRAAQSSLAWLAPRIAAIPTTPLSLPPILSSLARADAMAEGAHNEWADDLSRGRCPQEPRPLSGLP